MFRGIRRYSAAIQTIAIVGICAIILGATIVSKPRAATCPCGVGAAFVAATGSTITAFTLAQVTELYLVLWQGFAAIHTQINGNTGANEETMSYQTQAVAHVHRQQIAQQQTMESMRPATAGFQATAASGAGGAELNTNLARDAILQENYEWLTNLDEGTASVASANAAYHNNRRLSMYCNQRDAALGLCDLPDPRLIDADVDASTLEPHTLDEELVGAAIDRCRNLTGLPNAAPTASDYSSGSGIAGLASRDTANARSMTAFAMCDYLVAMRTELPEESIRAWAEEVVQRITGGVGLPPPANSCRPLAGSGNYNMPYIPTACDPFQPGFSYPGKGTLGSDQINVLNLMYSELVSHGINHYAALAVAMTAIEESNAGRNLQEAWYSSCPAATNGPTMCALPPISDARQDCTPAGACGYVPTGLGLIQWSGWEEDGCWGEGCNLQKRVNPNTGMNFQKCDLVAAADGGCAASHEAAIQNNVAALLSNLAQKPSVASALSQPMTDASEAVSIVTHDWVRPYGPAAATRPGHILSAISNNGLDDPSSGNCSGAPVASTGGTTGGTSPVLVHTSTGGGTTSAAASGVPGRPITVSLQSPMAGSGLRQTDCFGNRSAHGNRFHPANDIVSDSGVVYAAGAGEVIAVLSSCPQSGFSGSNSSSRDCGGGWGNYIKIRHADGSTTQYNHLAPGGVNVRVGDTVGSGQPIGQMGNTGGSGGAHLDFIVKTPDGHDINPHAVVSGLPANVCGSNMQTVEYLGRLSGGGTNPSTWIALDGSLQSAPGSGNYADGSYPGSPGGSCGATADLGLNIDAEHISHLELMKLVSGYRFQDPGWMEFVNSSASRGQLVREFNLIGATKMYMNWQAYDRQMQTAAVVSAWAAGEAERMYGVGTK